MKSGSSAAIATGSQWSATVSIASCSQTSRSASQGMAPPVRLTTSWRTPERPARALSALVLRGVRRPPRGASSAVTRSLAPKSSMRERSASGEKPAKTMEWMAPMRVQASMA